jgi:hypothetical protein
MTPSPPPYFVEDTAWLKELAEERPELAVVGAYAELEKALKQLIEEQGTEAPGLAGMRLVDAALEAGVIARPVADAMKSLRGLRNAAAHGGSVDVTRAQNYIDLCEQVRFILTWDRGS